MYIYGLTKSVSARVCHYPLVVNVMCSASSRSYDPGPKSHQNIKFVATALQECKLFSFKRAVIRKEKEKEREREREEDPVRSRPRRKECSSEEWVGLADGCTSTLVQPVKWARHLHRYLTGQLAPRGPSDGPRRPLFFFPGQLIDRSQGQLICGVRRVCRFQLVFL